MERRAYFGGSGIMSASSVDKFLNRTGADWATPSRVNDRAMSSKRATLRLHFPDIERASKRPGGKGHSVARALMRPIMQGEVGPIIRESCLSSASISCSSRRYGAYD